MKPLEDIYKGSFFGKRYKLNWRAEHVCNAIISVLNPASIIDVGCATGDIVARFNEMGVVSWGVEGSIRAKPFAETEYIHWLDIRNDWSLVDWVGVDFYEVCMCFEVAEHIEPEYADQFVDNLYYLSDKLLITAAPPGQDGHYHVNCQPKEYWVKKFAERGYIEKAWIAEFIKQQWFPWRKKPGIKAFYDNLLYFEKEGW